MSADTSPAALDSRHEHTDRRPVRVTRELPLAWLLTMLGTIAAQAIALWAGQQTQGQQLQQLNENVRTMAADVKPVSVKVTEHEVRLADHERRLQALEAARSR